MVNYIQTIVLVFVCSGLVWTYDKELTIQVDAGQKDCFYHNAKVGDIIDIEYQVINGGHGDFDINFHLFDPIENRVLLSDHKKSENSHRHDVTIEGDYIFCFDNEFSSFNRKVVFFELIVENETESSNQEQIWNDVLEGLTPEEFYEVKVQTILDYIGRIRMQITKARQLQDIIRSYEARDRNIAEENYFKVNTWSMFQIIVMLAVGALQVFMVRSIFETNTKMYHFWQKLGI